MGETSACNHWKCKKNCPAHQYHGVINAQKISLSTPLEGEDLIQTQGIL